MATLEAIGGVGGALAGEAERLYQALDEREQRIARRAFLGMVQLGEGAKDTRRRVEVARLVAVDENTEEVLAVLRCFAQPGARLLMLGVNDEQRDQVEVTHEALFDHWQRLRAWIEEGRADLRFHILEGHRDAVLAAAFSPDGARIVTASRDKTARLWDGRTGKALATLDSHGDAVLAAIFSPDGARIVTASEDKTARLWDVQLESRLPQTIDKLVRCYMPFRLVDEQLVPVKPDPRPCQQ